ncbi:MAG: CocE/NonD family hydrolase [Acidobacteriia bacterium]|nr:CocE/NonD family hydrolase [Terriglobia bacterium]
MSRNRPRLEYFITVVLLVLLAQARSTNAQAPAATPDPQYDVVVAKNVMVAMRDGVKLATDIYLPARDGVAASGKFPVLVCRTPYGKNPPPITSATNPMAEKEMNAASYFAKNGYVVVLQDVRGRFDSEGKFYFAINEGPDGYDTVEWAASQPWSNGKVGTYGASYMAHVQNAMAVLRPPHLSAMFITVGAGNYFEEGAWRGGAFMLLHNVFYALTSLAMTSHEARANPVTLAALTQAAHQDLGSWLLAYPYRSAATPFSSAPAYEKWFQDYVDHYTYDDYWKQNGLNAEVSYDKYPDIPMYFTTGWYDFFERGSLNNFKAMASRHKSPTKLLVGPWEHSVNGPRFTGDVDFGPTAEFDMFAEQLRWFNQTLKGEETGILHEPPVRVFVMGGGSGSKSEAGRMQDGGQWIATTAWPPPGAVSRSYYLHSDGSLSERSPEAEAPSVYEYDPAHPVPSIGGQMNGGVGPAFPADGPRDQVCSVKTFGCDNDLPLASRRDVRVFQTPPLESDVEIAGPVSVDLWISSSAPDTDFTAKLVDVAPPSKDYPFGFAMNIEDRIIRVRWSQGLDKPAPLKAGEVRMVTIDLIAAGNRFTKGHRIRVDISSSNFPYFDLNPNTGERPGYSTHMEKALNMVYHDSGHPSHLNLTVMPSNSVSP